MYIYIYINKSININIHIDIDIDIDILILMDRYMENLKHAHGDYGPSGNRCFARPGPARNIDLHLDLIHKN